jgi:hypothetical protein
MSEIPSRTPMVIRDVPDAIAAIPYLLGFHPVDSLVVIGYEGPHNTCAVRIDLPLDDPAEAAGYVAAMLAGNDFRRALVIGYGPQAPVHHAAATVGERLAAHGLSLTDAARVSNGRWWSLTCTNVRCCGPAGKPYDISSSVVAAQATYSGHVALPDRSDLSRTVAPVTGRARTAMQAATRQVDQQLKRWQATLSRTQYHRRVTQKGLTLIEALLTTPDPPTKPPSSPEENDTHQSNANSKRPGKGSTVKPEDDEVAWLGFLLLDLRIRDEAWVRINEEDPTDDIRFWRDVLCRVDDDFANAPASLLAYAAYVGGDGGLANVALDRASPDYSMAVLLRTVIDAGIPPSEVRIHMTPEDLANIYTQQNDD